MEKSYHNFHIAALGYLQDIIEQDGIATAKICMIQAKGDTEEVWLNCVIKRDYLKHLLLRFKKNLNADAVTIKFTANYNEFLICHHGQTEDDIDRIVQLKAELFLVHAMYINGMKIRLPQKSVM